MGRPIRTELSSLFKLTFFVLHGLLILKTFMPFLILQYKLLSTFSNNLQGELLSLSSQLSTLPRRAEVVFLPGDLSWKKYFPIISTTLSSSDKAGIPFPKSSAVVYTIPILVSEAPVSPPNVWSVWYPCIELVEQSGCERAARSF